MTNKVIEAAPGKWIAAQDADDAFHGGLLVSEPLYRWTVPLGPISRQWTQNGAGLWRYVHRQAVRADEHLIAKMAGTGQTGRVHAAGQVVSLSCHAPACRRSAQRRTGVMATVRRQHCRPSTSLAAAGEPPDGLCAPAADRPGQPGPGKAGCTASNFGWSRLMDLPSSLSRPRILIVSTSDLGSYRSCAA